ncbi:hypothetical protein [Alcaligenes faecalis]|uniref:hypothetical protein n=1 Tax=Alcaligenes faecalis TaxID=511 RepID=UPI0013F4F771|nr:hypothetical protein [Alcaligenes faecalis]
MAVLRRLCWRLRPGEAGVALVLLWGVWEIRTVYSGWAKSIHAHHPYQRRSWRSHRQRITHP